MIHQAAKAGSAETILVITTAVVDIASKLNELGDVKGASALCVLIECLEKDNEIITTMIADRLYPLS